MFPDKLCSFFPLKINFRTQNYIKGTQNIFLVTQSISVKETWAYNFFCLFPKAEQNNSISVYKIRAKISTFLPATFIHSFSTKEKYTKNTIVKKFRK